MITEFLEEQASLFVCGLLPAAKREQFELLLQCDEELRHLTVALAETTAPLTPTKSLSAPSPDLKSRILAVTEDEPQNLSEGLVMSDPQAHVQWINPAFTAMCGYSLDELQGKKLGPILQGEKTNPVTAQRIRDAIKTASSCREIILNYHKDGHPYWVEIILTPIRDDSEQAICLIAREYERSDIALP